MEIIDAGDWCFFKGDDDVSRGQAALSSRTVQFNPRYQDTLIIGEFMMADQSRMDRGILAGQSEIASPDFAVPNDPRRD